MPRRRRDLPERLRDVPFRTAEAGVGRNRLAAPDVLRAYRGVQVAAGGPADWRDKPEAQALRARFGHRGPAVGPAPADAVSGG